MAGTACAARSAVLTRAPRSGAAEQLHRDITGEEEGREHQQLDEAVAAAHGWPRSAACDPAESNRRLLELNRQIAAGEVEYRPSC